MGQVTGRLTGQALDKTTTETWCTVYTKPDDERILEGQPENGVYMQGIYIEGARCRLAMRWRRRRSWVVLQSEVASSRVASRSSFRNCQSSTSVRYLCCPPSRHRLSANCATFQMSSRRRFMSPSSADRPTYSLRRSRHNCPCPSGSPREQLLSCRLQIKYAPAASTGRHCALDGPIREGRSSKEKGRRARQAASSCVVWWVVAAC